MVDIAGITGAEFGKRYPMESFRPNPYVLSILKNLPYGKKGKHINNCITICNTESENVIQVVLQPQPVSRLVEFFNMITQYMVKNKNLDLSKYKTLMMPMIETIKQIENDLEVALRE